MTLFIQCTAPTTRDTNTPLLASEIQNFNYRFIGPVSIERNSPVSSIDVDGSVLNDGDYTVEVKVTDIYGKTGLPGVSAPFKIKDGLVDNAPDGVPSKPTGIVVTNQ